jgi:hypothetical protein
MPQWFYDRQPRGLNGDCAPHAPAEGDKNSKVQEAAERFFQHMREKAANKPRDPLEQTKVEVLRAPGSDGRFEGPRHPSDLRRLSRRGSPCS